MGYVRETRRLEGLPSSTETTFYPDIKLLLSAVLKNERLPFDIITGTSESGARRRDMPDFVLGDSTLFVGVYGEVKRANASLAELAVSTEQNDQIGRYLSQTGVVLLCNVRAIGLLTCDPSFTRKAGKPVPPAKRVLEKTVDLWSAVTGGKQKVDPSAIDDLVSIVTRVVTDLARIGSPAKRQGLLASLPTGSPPKDGAVPTYELVTPSQENRWRLGPKTTEGGFEAWPSLDEMFPTHFQGINHNRGLEGGIIGTDRAVLEQRLRAYFAAENFLTAKEVSEEIATARARYDPEKVWLKLKTAGHFREDAIVPLLTFPFDRRYIYYVATDKWLNEARQEFARNLSDNEWLVTVPEPRKASETWPVYAKELVNLHVHQRGSVVFPRETRGEDLLADRDANIPEATWRILRKHFGLKGERRDDPARALAGKLLRVAAGILHAPRYQAEQ